MKKIYILSFICFSFFTARSQWNNDTLVRNVICNRPNNQYQPRICNDGYKGAIICWTDLSFIPSRIYAQRIDSTGHIKWAPNGVLINDTVGNGFSAADPAITRDNSGGAVIAYTQVQNGGAENIYAIRIDANGQKVWSQPVAVDVGNDARSPEITNDNNGAIINWYRYNGASSVHVYVQWLDGTGIAYMPANGLQASVSPTAHYDSHTTWGGSTYGYIVFHDNDTLRLQCFNTSGVFLWSNPLTLSTTFSSSTPNYDIVHSINNDVIVSWMDSRPSSQPGIYAQRVGTSGSFLWAAGGNVIDTANYSHLNLQMCRDELGGAFITFGSGTNYIQRIKLGGSKGFSNSLPECSAGTLQNYSQVVPDGYGGVIYCWQDSRGDNGVYAQRIDTAGAFLWRSCGSPVFNLANGGNNNDVRLTARSDGTAIAAFFTSSGASQDIVAAKVENVVATGINDFNEMTDDFSIYPNPAHDQLTVSMYLKEPANVNMQLADITGRIVLSENSEANAGVKTFDLNLKHFSKGIYALTIRSGNHVHQVKVVAE